MLTFKDLEKTEILQTIVLPLIVPSEEEVENIRDLDLSKSALNACYSKPIRNKRGDLISWFEVEIKIKGGDNLPPKEKWFYIITDDERRFKARFIGNKIKTLSSFEDKEIIGKWIKKRLINLALVADFKFAFQDRWRDGVITKEILKEYGGSELILKKTTKTKRDERGRRRAVWLLSFPSEKHSNERLEELNNYVVLIYNPKEN